jgi:hypothetical protein
MCTYTFDFAPQDLAPYRRTAVPLNLHTSPSPSPDQMAQVTLYLDDTLLAKMRETAAALRISQSQFVGNLIREAHQEHWPQEVVLLAGALPQFPLPEALRDGEGAAAEPPPR